MIDVPTMPVVDKNKITIALKAMAVMTKLKVSVARTPR